jgi:hypothetical protein
MEDDKNLKDSKVISDLMRDFKLSAKAEADNRTRALYVLDFTRPGADQWTADQVKARGSRATYSFNQLPKFGRQVINDQWQNVPQIKYIPQNGTNADKAELLEDKIREIQACGSAQTAYKLAIASQINIGWGYFAFGTDYDNDETLDQNIYIRQIPNTFQIYDDPTTREQDRSDRRYLIEIEDIPRTEFNKNSQLDYTNSDLVSIGDDYPDWANIGEDLVRIGHYWRIEYDKSQLWAHKETGEVVKEKPKNIKDYNVRDVKKGRVMYYKCTALDLLETREWQGEYIPYCFVEGNKSIVDGKVYYTGIYEDMISTQVLYNYATNTAIELAESAPIAPFVGDSRAFKGFEKFYDEANTKNYSYLPFNGVDSMGNPIPAPQRLQNGADLSSAVSLIQMAEQNFYGTSGIYPASLGQQSNEKSGKAIIARQKEGDVSTSNYADMFGRALLYGGKIFMDLSKEILDGAREIQVMTEDKKTRSVKINQKYTDEKTGKPMYFDLTEGKYEVMVTTGPSYSTKREEAREAQIQLFQAAPQAMLPALPMIIRNMDWPQADKTADAVERGLPPELRDPERQEEQMKGIPPVVAAQLQQAQQIIEQLGGELQQAQAMANDNQAENQAKLGELQVKAEQTQNQAAKDQAEAQYKAAELQFEREKFATESALEQQKLELEKMKVYTASVMKDFENALGTVQSELANVAQVNVNTSPESPEQAVELNQQAESAAALVQTLQGIQDSFNQFTASISAPRQVVRDPQTGLATGVVTVV